MANRVALPQPLPGTAAGGNSVLRQPQAPPSPELAEVAQSLQVHLHSLADEILLFARGDGVAIALAANGELRCRATSGVAPLLGARIDARSGLTGACLRSGTLLRCDDCEEDQRVDRQVCRVLGIRAMICVPVCAGQEVVGIFEIFSSQPNAFLNLDTTGLRAKAEEIANCFAAEEALARAAVATVSDLGAAGDLAPSRTPTPRPARIRKKLSLSSKMWQAALGALVFSLGLFLLLRAIRASGPVASAWIAPQPASAAPRATQPEEMDTSPVVQYRTSPPRVRTLAKSAAKQRLIVASDASAVPGNNSSESGSNPLLPPDALIAAEAPRNDPMNPLVSSLPPAQPLLIRNLRVSTGVQQPILTHRVDPVYPALAKQSGIEGAVVLEAVVNKSGQVADLRVISGNTLLVGAAIRAVQQWRYRPYSLNGEIIKVPIRITLNFKLGK
jgi:TonB family protein